MSDHHTRAKANLQDASLPPPRVLGCLLGQQAGRVVDVSNSFEFVYEATAAGLVIDEGLLTKKTEQCKLPPCFTGWASDTMHGRYGIVGLMTLLFIADKQVFPKLDIVGWYATGEEIQDDDMAIHRKVQTAALVSNV